MVFWYACYSCGVIYMNFEGAYVYALYMLLMWLYACDLCVHVLYMGECVHNLCTCDLCVCNLCLQAYVLDI